MNILKNLKNCFVSRLCSSSLSIMLACEQCKLPRASRNFMAIFLNAANSTASRLFAVITGLVPVILLQRVTNLVNKFALLFKRSILPKDCRNSSGNDDNRCRLSVCCSVFNAFALNVILRRERSELSGESRNIKSIVLNRMYHPGHSANELTLKAKDDYKSVLQSGHSMIEMLGVLAIIAVLSVGGIAGYSKAMHQWKISRQKTQIAELFLQCINLKEDFLREWYKTNKAVPTASIMEAMNVIPDGMKKSSNTTLVDSNHNNMMIYVSSCNGQTSCLEYRIMFNIAITDKSNNLAQEYCVTFLEQAQAIKPYIYYIERRSHDTLSTDDYSSDLFDINKANPVNMRNFCKICEAKSFCALHLKFKI